MGLIYVVEDNNLLLNDTVQWINQTEHDCQGALNASEFDELMDNEAADLVILDWMLPGEDGKAIAHRLSSSPINKHIGIIFVTALSHIEQRISGLDVADAYLTKPVNYSELSAMINSVMRRIKPVQESIVMPSWKLSTHKQLVFSPSGETITLTWRESNILALLIENLTTSVSAQEMVKAIDEQWLNFEKNRLEVLLYRLRVKLKNKQNINFNPIRSYRNKGYQLMLPFIIED